MGRYDYQKSYARQIESIVVVLCAVYQFTELFLGYNNKWSELGQIAVLSSMLVSWIFFFGKYQSYEIRANVISAMSQVTIIVCDSAHFFIVSLSIGLTVGKE